jgi:predicted nucleic acid-binding protein
MFNRVVLDTNVFVAAGFNPGSHSAHIIRAIRQGELDLIWNTTTRDETKAIVQRIPPLSWERFAGLFRPEGEHTDGLRPGEFAAISDPDDRKFAALAAATEAILISNDDHLLSYRERAGLRVMSPGEFMRTRR